MVTPRRTLLLCLSLPLAAQPPEAGSDDGNPGRHPRVLAASAGNGVSAGFNALLPWANRLWAVSTITTADGSDAGGLYTVDEHFELRAHAASVAGWSANRLVHVESQQAFLGPYAIDRTGSVRVIQALTGHRLAATARHLLTPAERVYFLTVGGLLFEVDVKTLAATQLFDLGRELQLDGAPPRFAGMATASGRLVVGNRTYEQLEYAGDRQAGRLAEWDGKEWRVLEYQPFLDVHAVQARGDSGSAGTLWAVGFDRDSALLYVLHDDRWQRYRLPKGRDNWDRIGPTPTMRIRACQNERFLLDACGVFYDLTPTVYAQRLSGLRPIASHLRLVPDFCTYRGLIVLAGHETDLGLGEPQAALWLGTLDELWRFGKPAGSGCLWRRTSVGENQATDPFLMAGFDAKVLHLRNDGSTRTSVSVEVDFLGDGSYATYTTFDLAPGEYVHHEFPDGYGAQWLRLVATSPGVLTAQVDYR